MKTWRDRRSGPRHAFSTRCSGPVGEDFLRFDNLFCRTGEIELQFSRPARDLDFDRFEAAVLHFEAELFVGFMHPVFLKAIAHAGASEPSWHISTTKAGAAENI